MTLTISEKHERGLCTVIGCEEPGAVRVTAEIKGLFFIECLCKAHLTQYDRPPRKPFENNEGVRGDDDSPMELDFSVPASELMKRIKEKKKQ